MSYYKWGEALVVFCTENETTEDAFDSLSEHIMKNKRVYKVKLVEPKSDLEWKPKKSVMVSQQQKLQDGLVEEVLKDYNSNHCSLCGLPSSNCVCALEDYDLEQKQWGKFEKYFWNIWTYDRRLTDKQAEELQDKSNFNVRAVMKVIEIAREEFPFDKLNIAYINSDILNELKDWYIRWFRPRIVKSIEELETSEGIIKPSDVGIYSISPTAKYCPECGTKLTIVRCLCHRWCNKCKKSLRVEL